MVITTFSTVTDRQTDINRYGARQFNFALIFYRSMIAMERYCYRMASVRPSVRLSVCDADDSWSRILGYVAKCLTRNISETMRDRWMLSMDHLAHGKPYVLVQRVSIANPEQSFGNFLHNFRQLLA